MVDAGRSARIARDGWSHLLAPVLLFPFLVVFVTQPSVAAVFTVTNTADALPAPAGSLREAIEFSEGNGEADVVVFAVDGGIIDLVAPLPTLLEGGLEIQERRESNATPPGGNPIVIRGANAVARAFEIRSSDNVVSGLDFVDFPGDEVILILGEQADRNEILGCVFGGDLDGSNAGAAVRIAAEDGAAGFPDGTQIVGNRFVRNGSGVVVGRPNLAASPPDAETRIARSWFGTDAIGNPGAGNGEAVRVSNGGLVRIEDSRFSGPGLGIRLGPNAAGSLVAGNEIGVLGSAADTCAGFTGPAVQVDRSQGVEIRRNRIRCSGGGVLLDVGSEKAELHDNEIGGTSPAGHAGDGVVIAITGAALLRRNAISGNTGFGVASGPGPSLDPPDAILACNEIRRNGSGAVGVSFVAPGPPTIDFAGIVSVHGGATLVNPGWVEVFGDDLDEAGVFQGALRLADASDPPFRHRLPVLGLFVNKIAGGALVGFDRTVPTNHTAAVSDQAEHRTSALSFPLEAATEGLAFDLIRGNLDELALAPDGIGLGEVQCLASGMDPDPTVSPNVVDPEEPLPGRGFFYLSRRRDRTANVSGTYDPAICLTEVDRFAGPRIPRGGDCP